MLYLDCFVQRFLFDGCNGWDRQEVPIWSHLYPVCLVMWSCRPNYWCGCRHSTSSRPLTELTTEIPASPRTINKLLAISQDAMFSARLVFISYCDRPSISEPPSWSPCMWTMRSWTARYIYLNLKNSSSLAPGVLRDRGRKLASLTPILLTYEYFDAVSYFIHI